VVIMEVSRLDVESVHRAFSPAHEIQDPERFVGRPEEINAGIAALMNRGGFMVVFGLRGVGKSSRVPIEAHSRGRRQIAQTAPNGSICAAKGI